MNGEDWELFRLLSHILGDTINQTQLRRIPDMLDHLVSIHMVSQEPESWAEVGCQKKLQLQLYVSIIFPIPKNHKKSPVSHKIPSYHHCCCPEAPKKSAQPVPRRCVHRKLQPIAARFTPEELLALGDRATGNHHGVFSEK